METSNEVTELFTALSAAQGSMSGAIKGKANTFFKSSYSDLAAVIEAISEPFAENGLAFIQAPCDAEHGFIAVETRITHKSGQWIQSQLKIPAKNDAQGYGSGLTYAKRYALQAMAGVPSIDDDGNAATRRDAKPNIEHYPQKAFDENIIAWAKAINEGKDPQAIIKFIESKGNILTDNQKQVILNVKRGGS